MRGYRLLLPRATRDAAQSYLTDLRAGVARPGDRLALRLRDVALRDLDAETLLGCLCDTKRPQIFAESEIAGDGSDWTLRELALLGDLSVAVPVTVFDDGRHVAPTPHAEPFDATLVFTPGALLRNDRGHAPADWSAVTTDDGAWRADGYYELYRRRLLTVLRYVDADVGRARGGFVTVPGLGCGQFAGPFRGRLGERLRDVLARLLHEEGATLPNLRAIYYDPYDECAQSRERINGIDFLVRPLRRATSPRPQLCAPQDYADDTDDYAGCRLYSLVAWDHVSWPGNDFYVGARSTDDGVKAAATDAMAVLTGVAGRYDVARGCYLPPAPFRVWQEVVNHQRRRLWDARALWRDAG
ncbi:MAG: hypothetical protein K2Y51_08035 [Gammaproteobacteria bacterium]|nr:hypothetical protein [Gammaproteobacteria bacterium]